MCYTIPRNDLILIINNISKKKKIEILLSIWGIVHVLMCALKKNQKNCFLLKSPFEEKQIELQLVIYIFFF